MDYMSLIQQILEVCIIPLLGVLTTYLVMFIKKKSAVLAEEQKNETMSKYILMLADTITTCVVATNQTYVDSLKKNGAFTKEAQEIALKMTLDAVMNILTDEAQIYLSQAYGDLQVYILQQIEATVKENK